MENKMEILGLNYDIVRDWMTEYEDSNTFYPIEKFVTNFPKQLKGSKVRILLGEDTDEIIEIR